MPEWRDETVRPVKAGREPNRKMAISLFCQWNVCPNITLFRLKTTNCIGKSSGTGLGYDL